MTDPTADADSLEDLLAGVQPRLSALLTRYQIPESAAEELLRDVFLTLIYKRDRISSPDRWVLASVERQCLLYRRRKRQEVLRSVDETILGLVSSLAERPEEQERFRVELDGVLLSLPLRCREALRSRYGLAGSEAGFARGLASDRGGLDRCLAALTRRLARLGYLSGQGAAFES